MVAADDFIGAPGENKSRAADVVLRLISRC
jgi:hypothetical protein